MNTDKLEGAVAIHETRFLDEVAAYLVSTGVVARVETDMGKPILVLPEWDGDDGFTVSFETEGYERALNIVPFAADRFPSLPTQWPAQTALCITRWIDQLERERLVPHKSAVQLARRFAGEEWIVSNVHNDAWKCICGNDVMSDGFAYLLIRKAYPAVADSTEGDEDLVICQSCGRLMDPATKRLNPDATDEWDSYIVKVVGQYPADRITDKLFDLSEPEPPKKSPQEWGPWGPEGRQGE